VLFILLFVGSLRPASCVETKDLTASQNEGILRAQGRLQGLAFGVTQGRTKIGSSIPQRITFDYHLVWRCTRTLSHFGPGRITYGGRVY
jgi:hypothetical protein